MGFEILINVDDNENITNCLVLPAIFKNKIPKNCQRIRIVDYKKEKYNVNIKTLRTGQQHLHGIGWTVFVNSNSTGGIKTLYFKWKKDSKFEVLVFNKDNLEIRKNPSRPVSIHACVVDGTDESCYIQELPHRFLEPLTNNKSVKIHGPNQDALVDVHHVYPTANITGIPAGFKGKAWPTFCFENNIEDDHKLVFINKGTTTDYIPNYAVKVFNKEGLGLHVHSPNKCSHYQHHHHTDRPRYTKKFQSHALTTKRLTIPRKFVREHKIYAYSTATLRYGCLKYKLRLRVNKNDRYPGDQTHVHMVTDWRSFLLETGLTEEKNLRFQLYEEKSIPGEMVYFKVC